MTSWKHFDPARRAACRVFRFSLINNHLVRFDCPIAEQIHVAHDHAFGEIIQPETSGFGA